MCERAGNLRGHARDVSALIKDAAREPTCSEEVKEKRKVSLEGRIGCRIAEQVCENPVVEDAVATTNRRLTGTTGQFAKEAAGKIRTISKAEAWGEVVVITFPQTQVWIGRILAHQLELESISRLWSTWILVNQRRQLTINFVRNAVVIPT